jgi:hypothetical protein
LRGNESDTRVTVVQSGRPGHGCWDTVVHGWVVCGPGMGGSPVAVWVSRRVVLARPVHGRLRGRLVWGPPVRVVRPVASGAGFQPERATALGGSY